MYLKHIILAIMLIGWLAPTHALVCKSQLTETQASVDNFQQRMKIALARADLTTMNTLYMRQSAVFL
jgi:hypothetical protein